MASTDALAGRRVLVVEDEWLIVLDTVMELEGHGAHVVGPMATVEQALEAARSEPLDAAVLDVNLQGKLVFPVAEVLTDRGVPFLFATGYDPSIIPSRFGHVRRCQKPIDLNEVASVMAGFRDVAPPEPIAGPAR